MNMLDQLAGNDFMPHGHCYFWEPFILWSHAISDTIIALAYFIIPLSLIRIVRKRNDFTYIWMVLLFAIFILGCGATHVFDVINIWEPFYRSDAVMRMVTAAASVGTAVLLVRISPKLILIPSATQWRRMNEELRLLNENLEKKVQERTAELAQSAAQFEFLTDSIPHIVWTAQPSGGIDYFNKNWYSFSGLTLEQSKEHGWQETLHPEEAAQIKTLWKEHISAGEKFDMEYTMKGADGMYRWHQTRAIPMKGEEGVLKWFGTTTDIHDQKLRNEELRRVNEELDGFVYTASHDLKSPVSNLESLLSLIFSKYQSSLATDLQGILGMMQKQVVKLKDIIRDLSDVSRIQKETADNQKPVELEQVYEECMIIHQELLRETGAEVSTAFEVSKVYFPAAHLRSLIHNLLSNALKYTVSGRKPLIRIQTCREGECWVLRVEDNGRGIKHEHTGKIFNMFTRLSRDREGTGMGLYLVKRIAEKYGGRVAVETQEGQGTTFKVYLKETDASSVQIRPSEKNE